MQRSIYHIVNIQSDVNIINTCNHQWGAVGRIIRWNFNNDSLFPPTLQVPSSYLINLHYLVNYSLDQHSITNILEGLKNNDLENEGFVAVGFAKGYSAYMDCVNRRPQYWESYFNYFWFKDEELRKLYKNDQIKYQRAMFDTLEHPKELLLENDSVKHINANVYSLFSKKRKNIVSIDVEGTSHEFELMATGGETFSDPRVREQFLKNAEQAREKMERSEHKNSFRREVGEHIAETAAWTGAGVLGSHFFERGDTAAAAGIDHALDGLTHTGTLEGQQPNHSFGKK
jgi:hypothetical protein